MAAKKHAGSLEALRLTRPEAVGLGDNKKGHKSLIFRDLWSVFSGEGGIRTLGTVARTPVFETHPHSTEGAETASTSGDTLAVLALPLALEGPNTPDPDLARILAAWPSLPPHIRAAVLVLVQSATC